MPDLEHTLQGRDLGFLKMISRTWGLDLSAPDAATALPLVVQGILDHSDFSEVIEALPDDAKNVLLVLLQNEGRMLWAAFARKFGDVRRMGAARLERERPDLKPASAVEVLWYRGLIGRAFLAQAQETTPQEYAYIPDDILPLLPTLRADTPDPLGRPATPNESAHPVLANDSILDHACTLLAALRVRLPEADLNRVNLGGIPRAALTGLLRANLLLEDMLPHPERTRAFLEAPRGKALAQLAKAWMEDPVFNELRLLPGLKFEGEWQNDSLHARQVILELVSQIPENRWWSLSAFVAAVHEQQPDFQRPGGDYDSWFIRKEAAPGTSIGAAVNGEYLRGFGAWDEIDGALVRFLICGPMHWLGLVDLAAAEPGGPTTALRLSRWAAALWQGSAPEGLSKEAALIRATSEGRLTLPLLTPRPIRYQVARFCQWESGNWVSAQHGAGEKESRGEYHYRANPAALERAKAQGLRPSQLLNLLRRHHEGTLPPALVQALERWEVSGAQALVERVSLLRVTTPEILAALRKTRAAKYLGDALNETTVIIRPGSEDPIINALAEMGYLAEAKLE